METYATEEASAGAEGCLVCGKNDDHPKLLLCDGCDGEYHMYCLQPPLVAVPKNDWFCDACLLEKVKAEFSAPITSQHGEVCWAKGISSGWWPAIKLMENLVPPDLRKHLRARHLVYLFERKDLPFSIVTQDHIKEWGEGRSQFYKGRLDTQSQSKHLFLHAFQAARVQARNMKSERSNSLPEEPQVSPAAARTGTRASSKRSLAQSNDSTTQSRVPPESPRKRAKPVAEPPRVLETTTIQVANTQLRLRNSKKKVSQELFDTPTHRLMAVQQETPSSLGTPAPSRAPYMETKAPTSLKMTTSLPEDNPTSWSILCEPTLLVWCLVAILFFFLPVSWPVSYTILVLASAHFIFQKIRQGLDQAESVE